MRILVVSAVVFASFGARAESDCTFSAEHQAQVRANVLTKYVGGVENPKTHNLMWASGKSVVSFGYGGCVDIGSVVVDESALAQPRTEQEVFAKARQLAERFWSRELIGGDSIALDALLEGLERKQFEVSTIRGTTQYVIRNERFVELYVTHSYKDGWDSVSSGWQGNW